MDPVVPTMSPAPGERTLRFVGDTIRFTLTDGTASKGWKARLVPTSAAPTSSAAKLSRPTPAASPSPAPPGVTSP